MSSNCNFTSYPFHARRISHLDHVNIKDGDEVRELLRKYGDNYPDPEIVEYTAKLNKINKRNKKQLRVFILTNKALYNVKPSSINVLQRRIDIKDIASVTASITSLELTIHVPTLYDYRYQATDNSQKNEIIRMISCAAHRVQHRHLNIHRVHQSSTSEYTVNRNAAQLLSREQRHNRKRALMCRQVDINTTKRIKNLPLKLQTTLLSYGYVRDEAVYEMNFYIPTSIFSNVFKFYYIAFPLDDFNVINQVKYMDGSFPYDILTIEENNEYKRKGKQYIVKIVNKSDLENDAYNTLKIMENKRLLQRIGYHPYIQSLEYAFQTRTRLFTVHAYCEWISLHFLMKKHGSFSEQVSKIITAQICLAIGHLHRFNVYNIDVQPSKIVMDEYGFIQLTDILPINFNETNVHNIKAQLYSMEDISYWAPERIVCKQMILPSVDWWSVGILLYELCIGIKPFSSQNMNKLKNKILNGFFVYPKHMKRSAQFQDLIMKLLNKNGNKRMGSGVNDIKSIMRHSYFENIHWFNYKKKEISFPELNTILSKAFDKPKYFSSLNVNNVLKDMTHIINNDDFVLGKNETFADFTSYPE